MGVAMDGRSGSPFPYVKSFWEESGHDPWGPCHPSMVGDKTAANLETRKAKKVGPLVRRPFYLPERRDGASRLQQASEGGNGGFSRIARAVTMVCRQSLFIVTAYLSPPQSTVPPEVAGPLRVAASSSI
ncbi:hypothetical protein QQP08_025901 [Theobroma cacao]|nr:hypothetical protein QQP08_025901 [Theobroma cacao]